MIKKLIYFIIPFIFISFSQNVNAEEYYTGKVLYDSGTNTFYNSEYYINKKSLDSLFSFDLDDAYNNRNIYFGSSGAISFSTMYNNLKNGSYETYLNDYDYYIIKSWVSNYNNICFFNENENVFYFNQLGNGGYHFGFKPKSYKCLRYDGSTLKSSNDNFSNIYDNFSVNNNNIFSRSSTKKMVTNYTNVINSALTGSLSSPEINYSLEPIYKDGYLSSYGIKVNSSVVDDSKYKYQYSIKDNLDDDFNWVDLYNNNFLNNQFTYITKKPIYFYFRILDKSNNDIIDSFTITVSFDLISPQFNIIFNQDKFYLNGTNYINKVGLSIIYKTSIDGLKYQYQYVNDGSSLSDSNWLDTDGNVYQVYDTNGTLYARILDENNNLLYSSTFSNTLIGTQDFLENPGNFPLYNKVQSVLNFNKGSISDIVLIPVKILMFTSDSLNNNSCNVYSFGSLLGHELKLPCIDIKSYVGNTIYNFYDLVCSFFISLGIVRLLKNIYMRFMTLDIRDIDNKGGIF